MGKIAVLSQQMVNKIAAGEVVERPASVLKELMENSLDARARQIRVEIQDGGRKLIQVSDDGVGMTAEDLELAFVPHATSKLSREEDLYNIGTLGFRGEALASIASVSQVEAISRARGEIEGSKLMINGGKAEAIKPAAAPEGTTISVRNLFYNTPARRKFLRTANTEMSHLTEQFVRLGMVNSNVGFVLLHNGRKVHDLPAGSSVSERIARFFSHELAEGLMPVRRVDDNMEISGHIARPQHSRTNTQWQYVFLNGRHIRDKFISHAIREAYRGMMEINRQPIVFLFIKMDPALVDVNVHPAKTEVRFTNSNMVHSQVLAAIRDKLLGTDLTVPVRTDKLQSQTSSYNNAETNTDTDTNTDNERLEEHRQRVRQAMVDFFKNAPSAGSDSTHGSGSHGAIRNGNLSEKCPAAGAAAVVSCSRQGAAKPRYKDLNGTNQIDKLFDGNFDGNIQEAGKLPPSRPVQSDKSILDYDIASAKEQADIAECTEQTDKAESVGAFMQIHNSYLVIETPDGMVIVDQHALHERILYEKLLRNLQAGPLASQHCLIPEVIDVTPAQMAVLESEADTLKQFGVQLEQFGPSSVAVQAFPVMLDKAKPVEVIADLLDMLAEQSGKIEKEQLIHHVLDMMACKAAVKAGDKLNEFEIKSLLAQRKLIERSGNCPHGRPTTIRMTLAELEKQFKRT